MWICAAISADALGSNTAERRTNRPATRARVASFSGTSCLHQSCIHSVTMGCSTGQRQSHQVEERFVDTPNAVLEETHSRAAGVECRIPQVGAPPGRGWETGAGAVPRKHRSPRSGPPWGREPSRAYAQPPEPAKRADPALSVSSTHSLGSRQARPAATSQAWVRALFPTGCLMSPSAG